jgi:hypothetical protein
MGEAHGVVNEKGSSAKKVGSPNTTMLYPFPIIVGHKKKGRKQGQKMERV